MASPVRRLLQGRRRREDDRPGTAAALRHLVDAAEEPPSRWRAHGIEPPMRADAVLAARDDLLAIAALLEDATELPAAAVATASWLAWAPGSPICEAPEDADAEVARVAARLRAALAAATGA